MRALAVPGSILALLLLISIGFSLGFLHPEIAQNDLRLAEKGPSQAEIAQNDVKRDHLDVS